MFEIQQGGIHKLPFAYTDFSEQKYRPAVAIAPPDAAGDARFVFITTVPPPPSEQRLALGEADFEGPGLPFKSFVRPEKSMLLSSALVNRKLAQLTPKALQTVLRSVIQNEVTHFSASAHAPVPFVPGESAVPVSGKVIGTKELQLMVDASLDGCHSPWVR